MIISSPAAKVRIGKPEFEALIRRQETSRVSLRKVPNGRSYCCTVSCSSSHH